MIEESGSGNVLGLEDEECGGGSKHTSKEKVIGSRTGRRL